MKKTHASVTQGGSAVSRYKNAIVGQRSLWSFIYYEWCMLLSPIPGAMGIFLRKIFWRWLFGSCGTGVVFGSNVVVRHPHRILIGDRVVISEGCIIDARNDDSEKVIEIADDVILSNSVMISCKNGTVRVGARTGINVQTIIQSVNQCPVNIGEDVIIGPRCIIIGGSNYNSDRHDIPIWRQGIKFDGGVTVGNDIWLAANVTVLGGVKISAGSIVAAGAVVNRSIPVNTVSGGIPARVIKARDLK